ncbi:MAG: S1 RNA-binding domain-containing protein [Chloroflexi bacterium]|nr:S1 RNA-binding domain-containing protein [Chloroflexota bacterium]
MSDDVATTDPIKIADLRPKTQLQGKIKKIELFGAFVDVGAEKDGLLHISQLRKERTNRVEDVVAVGQDVTVWVRKTDANTGRIDLTLIEPLKLDWDEIKTGMIVKGKVNKLEKFGAFVDIGAERSAFIHVREMMSGHVDDPAEVVKMAQEVEAKVIAVDRKKRRIDLSLKALDDFTPEDDEPDEKPLTAMEQALRQAMKGERGDAESRRRKKNKSERPEFEELFERTRQQHVPNK